jgi:hypothetical protein
MLLIIAGVLAALWLLGILVHVGGSLIHLLLLVALVILVYQLVTRNSSTV